MEETTQPQELHIKLEGASTAQIQAVTLTLLGELMVDVRVLSGKVGAIVTSMPKSEFTEQEIDAQYNALDEVSSEAYATATELIQEKIDTLIQRVVNQQ